MSEAETRRCGLVAVVGAPNAGKSTLVNALAGTKVSIVSPKPQTTRFRIRAVVMEGAAQLILVDTPGIFRPRRRLDRAMVAAAWGGAQDADLALLIVDARAGLTEEVAGVLAGLKRGGPGRSAAAAALVGGAERRDPLRRDLHGLRAEGSGARSHPAGSGATRARRALALPGG